MNKKSNVRSNTPTFMRVVPKTAEQPIESKDEDFGTKNTKSVKRPGRQILNLDLSKRDRIVQTQVSENYQSVEISPRNKSHHDSFLNKRNSNFVLYNRPVVGVSNVRRGVLNGSTIEKATSNCSIRDSSPLFKPSSSVDPDAFQTAISRLVFPSTNQKSETNLSKVSSQNTQNQSKMMLRKKKKQESKCLESSRTTFMKEDHFTLKVSISRESLRTNESSHGLISSILSESDFQKGTDQEFVCVWSEETFKEKLDKYVKDQMKMNELVTPTILKELNNRRTEHFRDTYLHENSM